MPPSHESKLVPSDVSTLSTTRVDLYSLTVTGRTGSVGPVHTGCRVVRVVGLSGCRVVRAVGLSGCMVVRDVGLSGCMVVGAVGLSGCVVVRTVGLSGL